MAIHPVLSIRYIDDDPKVITKVEKIVKTKVEVEIKPNLIEKAWNVAKGAASMFNNFIRKISGQPYKEKEIAKIKTQVEEQDWIVEEEESKSVDKSTLQEELMVAAKFLVGQHRQELLMKAGPPRGPASLPGEYPAYRTTNLAKSITAKWRDRAKTIIDIGYKDINGKTGNPAEYSQYLADSGRLSIGETAIAAMPSQTRSGIGITWNLDGESN
jgi:hypothetical protein